MLRLIRYLIVAVLAYVVDMGGYYVMINHHVAPTAANVIVKIAAAICGFYLHRHFTYQIKDSNDVYAHAKKYFGLALLYTPASTAALFVIMLFLPSPIYAKALSDILLFVLTYWITTNFTFTRKELPKN